MQQLIETAIDQRRLIAFTYDDKPRLVEPHCLGFNKNGILMFRAYQVSGDEGWRLFTVEKMIDPDLSEVHFQQPRPGYKPGDKAMSIILIELEHAEA